MQAAQMQIIRGASQSRAVVGMLMDYWVVIKGSWAEEWE